MAAPLTADRLLKALRDEGLTVVEVGNWRTHNRDHKGPFGPVHGVMIHHTVTKGTANSVRICRDGYEGLPGPLCHGVIDKQGRVHLVGNGRTNHAGIGDGDVLPAVRNEAAELPRANEPNTDGNRYFYGFECENLGDSKDPWPEIQLEAIERAAAAICRAHQWSERSVIGHLEWQPGKVDPRGFTMASMRARIAERLTHPAGWSPGSTPTPPPEEEDDMAAVDVWAYKNTAIGETRDTYEYLRSTARAVARLEASVSGLTAAVQTLAAQLGEDVDTAAVVAAVEQAIADAVIQVDVDVNGQDAP